MRVVLTISLYNQSLQANSGSWVWYGTAEATASK